MPSGQDLLRKMSSVLLDTNPRLLNCVVFPTELIKSERQSQDSSAAVADSLLVARGKACGSSATV